MKRNRCKFYLQAGVFSTLATVGLLAMCGEPAEDVDFLTTFLMQIGVCAACWLTAAVLYHKWDLGRKLELLDKMSRRRAL